MARRRMIDPAFWTDEKIGGLSAEARLLYIGLWTFADDYGFFLYEPSKIKVTLYPYEDYYDITLAMKEIIDLGFVEQYVYFNRPLFHITKWDKWQKPQHPTPTEFKKENIGTLDNPTEIFWKVRYIPDRVKHAVKQRDKNKCVYCGRLCKDTDSDFEFDHIIPKSKGGYGNFDNIVFSCRKCNRQKHDKVINSVGLQKITETSPQANATATQADTKPDTPDAVIEKKPITDIQRVVLAYKVKSGHDINDKDWDKLNFPRCSKPAKQLLDYLKSWRAAVNCIDQVGEDFTKKGLSWTLETCCKWAADWKLKKEKEYAGNHD